MTEQLDEDAIMDEWAEDDVLLDPTVAKGDWSLKSSAHLLDFPSHPKCSEFLPCLLRLSPTRPSHVSHAFPPFRHLGTRALAHLLPFCHRCVRRTGNVFCSRLFFLPSC
jgi:hypothetical protein